MHGLYSDLARQALATRDTVARMEKTVDDLKVSVHALGQQQDAMVEITRKVEGQGRLQAERFERILSSVDNEFVRKSDLVELEERIAKIEDKLAS